MGTRIVLSGLGLALLCQCGSSGGAPKMDASVEPMPTGCPVYTGPGVAEAGPIATSTIWRASDSPHVVGSHLKVEAGATLTLEPCTEVRLGSDVDLSVEGALVAAGTPSSPILVRAVDPTLPWAYWSFYGGTGSLSYVTFEGGGKTDPNAWGVLEVRGVDDTKVSELLHLDHVIIDGSERYGLSARSRGTFTKDSTDVVVKNAQIAPIRVVPNLASNIPTGVYTGNARDEIVLAAEADVDVDTTFHDRGVPYQIGDDPVSTATSLRVQSPLPGGVATLTLEPGVEIRFGKGGMLAVEFATSDSPASGALVAVGTAAKPIILTSSAAAPAAGDWIGVRFASLPDPHDRLDFVQVSYAGGASSAGSFHCDLNGAAAEAEDAAIIFLGQPSGVFVTNTTITASAGYGVDRGWRGAPLDFAAPNVFHQVAKCKQSYPRDANGACPMLPIECLPSD